MPDPLKVTVGELPQARKWNNLVDVAMRNPGGSGKPGGKPLWRVELPAVNGTGSARSRGDLVQLTGLRTAPSSSFPNVLQEPIATAETPDWSNDGSVFGVYVENVPDGKPGRVALGLAIVASAGGTGDYVYPNPNGTGYNVKRGYSGIGRVIEQGTGYDLVLFETQEHYFVVNKTQSTPAWELYDVRLNQIVLDGVDVPDVISHNAPDPIPYMYAPVIRNGDSFLHIGRNPTVEFELTADLVPGGSAAAKLKDTDIAPPADEAITVNDWGFWQGKSGSTGKAERRNNGDYYVLWIKTAKPYLVTFTADAARGNSLNAVSFNATAVESHFGVLPSPTGISVNDEYSRAIGLESGDAGQARWSFTDQRWVLENCTKRASLIRCETASSYSSGSATISVTSVAGLDGRTPGSVTTVDNTYGREGNSGDVIIAVRDGATGKFKAINDSYGNDAGGTDYADRLVVTLDSAVSTGTYASPSSVSCTVVDGIGKPVNPGLSSTITVYNVHPGTGASGAHARCEWNDGQSRWEFYLIDC